MSAAGRLCDSGFLAIRQGKLDDAERLFQSAEHVARAAGDLGGCAAALNGRAGVARYRNRFADAAELLRQVVEIAEAADLPQELVTALGNRAALLREMNLQRKDPAIAHEAEQLVARCEQAARERGVTDMLQFALGTRALLLRDAGDLEGARPILMEQLALVRGLGRADETARCLANLGMLCIELCRPVEAQRHLDEAEALARRLNLTMLLDGLATIRAAHFGGQAAGC